MEARCRGGRVLCFPCFLFRGRGPGVFFSEEGRSFPFAWSKGFVFLSVSTKGIRPFLFSLRVSNLSLFSSEGSVCFLFRGRKGADFPEGCVERFRVFFLFEGKRIFSFLSGGEDFRTRRVAFPRATTLETSPGRTSELEGIQLPGSSRSPVDQRFFRKRTDSCFPLFLFSSNRSNLSLFSTKGSNLFLVS